MSTKSFIISLPIITGDQDRRRLQKSFSFGCNLQNAVMGGGWDRVLIYMVSSLFARVGCRF